MNPEDPKDLHRLTQSIRWSERKLRVFREKRMAMLRQFAGFNYGDFSSADKVPINLLELAISIYTREVASHSPQALVVTPYQQLVSSAADLELAINHLIGKLDLEGSLNAAGLDAMFLIGCVKIGVAARSMPAGDDGHILDPGEIFCDQVLSENYLWDMAARHIDRVSWEGDRFRVPLEWARENPDYNKEARQKLAASRVDTYDAERGGREIESETLTQGREPIIDEYKDHVDLLEVWLPDERVVVTVADGQESTPLKIVDWKGPERGPYRKICFGSIPGNIVPRPPASLLVDMHELANLLFNKTARQAERQKTILGVQGHAKADGSRVVEANDGDAIYTENPDGMREFTTGGANQQTLAMVIWLKQMFSYLGGNLDAIGGLAAQTQTVGQDSLLAQTASGRIRDMQKTFLKFTTGVVSDIAFHAWNDPLIKIPLMKPIAGTKYAIPMEFTPERRKGDFLHYNFTIEPYSLQTRSPEERLARITSFVEQIVTPILPVLAKSGIQLDYEEFFKIFSKYGGLPEIDRLLVYMQGQQDPSATGGGDQGDGAGMPAQTTRNYVRSNRPGATQQGAERGMMSSLLASGSQGGDLASMLK